MDLRPAMSPPIPATRHEYLTTQEAAAYLKVSYRSMLGLLKSIPHQKLGKGFRVKRADLDAWFDQGKHIPVPEEPTDGQS
jgi:excisionase family DNA binding protein